MPARAARLVRPARRAAAARIRSIAAPAGTGAAAGAARPAGPALPRWAAVTAAAAAGLALAGAFPPAGLWPLAIVGPALLLVALRGAGWRATFLLALGCGLVFYVALLSWLVNVAWYAWATLAVVEALLFAVLALALRPLLRLPGWPLAAAGWWVAQEAVQDRFPWGGFPWGRLAMSQPAAPTAGWAAIGGPPLLTFLLALAGAAVAAAVLRATEDRNGGALLLLQRHQRFTVAYGRAAEGPRTAVAAGLAALAVILVLCGNLAWRWTPGAGPSAVVATVQGDVPHQRNLPDQLRASRVTANHAAATIELARQVRAGLRPAPQVVIWPENSTDIDPSFSPPTYRAIAGAVAAIGRPVLVGAVLDDPVRNAGQLWLPGRGPVQVYIKRQLVPFGEVIPFRRFLELFTSLPSLQPQNFTPGHRAVVFRIGRIRLGDLICYEVGYDNLVRSEVSAGANVLAVQTNDADFELDGQLGETQQQLDMARMDAIWTGRPVAVASTTGISAIIDPDGALVTRSTTWVRAELEARVPLASAPTPADRAGAWPELGIVALTGLALAWAACRGLARRRLG